MIDLIKFFKLFHVIGITPNFYYEFKFSEIYVGGVYIAPCLKKNLELESYFLVLHCWI